MSGLGNLGEVGVFLLFVGWILYTTVRPLKDYYVLELLYFDRLYEEPWRGDQPSAHYHGFNDYLAAKALFDFNEREYGPFLDDAQREVEHSLFMVPARSKATAMARVMKKDRLFVSFSRHDKTLLHKTPYADILKRRRHWQDVAKEANG